MATYDEAGRTPPGVELEKATTDKEILEEARERLKRAIDENQEERKKQKDDLLFSVLDQWPSNIRAEREGDPNGARPCLTIDHINQYIVQVVNDMRQNRPAVKVRPVDDQADIQTAEVFQGIVRQIEDQSSAQIAYATAGESAVRVGEGYFRIITEYESEMSFDQVIRVKRVPDMFTVYLGPHSMPDGSDSEFGFVFEWMSVDKFRRLWPKAKYTAVEFDELNTDYMGNWWDEGKICVAEYFYIDYEKATLCFLKDGQTVVKGPKNKYPEEMIVEERETRIPSTKWCKLTGVEVLEKSDWAGKRIPIVKVVGKEAVVDGKRRCWGLVRPAKDSLRMYNYFASAITEKIGLSPKAPIIGAAGQFEGFEDRWSMANKQNFPYLEYNAKTVDGTIVPAPARQMPAPIEVAMVQQLQQIREDVQSSLGMFKASLGKEQPNQSGKAILALTRESDTGTFHFSDNQAISIQHCGRILIDLIPKIYDTQRIVKILGEDGKVRTAQIDPNSPVAASRTADATGKIQQIYNLGVGTYDVSVAVGPSFNTKRLEAATMFTDLANTAKDPVSGTVMRYLAIKNSDFNGAEQAAEMMEKLLPPGLIQKEGEQNIDPRAQAVINQMKQVIQAQGQKLQELESGAKIDMMKVQSDAQSSQAKIAADHDAKMKELVLKKEEQDKELELAREKANAEIQIKLLVADADAKIDKDKLSFEMECKREENAEKMKEKAKEQEAPLLENAIPAFVEALKEVTQTFTDAIKETNDQTAQLIDAVNQPKTVEIRNSRGEITRGTVRPVSSPALNS